MVIQKGADWGRPGRLADGAPVAASNASLQAAVRAGARVIGVTGGDLGRTVSASGALSTVCHVDLLHVQADGQAFVAVAHVIARRPLWRGLVVAAMNAEFVGSYDVAPRSHPNDGFFEAIDATLAFADRFKARKRLPTGTHLPHPGIRLRRVTEQSWTFDRPVGLWIDGGRVGQVMQLSVRIEPDALQIVF